MLVGRCRLVGQRRAAGVVGDDALPQFLAGEQRLTFVGRYLDRVVGY